MPADLLDRYFSEILVPELEGPKSSNAGSPCEFQVVATVRHASEWAYLLLDSADAPGAEVALGAPNTWTWELDLKNEPASRPTIRITPAQPGEVVVRACVYVAVWPRGASQRGAKVARTSPPPAPGALWIWEYTLEKAIRVHPK